MDGVSTVQKLETLVTEIETLILSLFDNLAVENVLDEILKFDLEGKQIIETSKVSPKTIIDYLDEFTAQGSSIVDTPISGGPELVFKGDCGLF